MTEFTKEQDGVGAHCPFCGDERNLVEIGAPFDDGICHVECARCGAHGPVESAEDRAISAWNLRAGGPAERPALNAKEFSREELETLAVLSAFESNPVVRLAQVAAFALAQMERAENAEAEMDRLKGELEEAEEIVRFLVHGDGYDGYRPGGDPHNGILGYTGTGGVWFSLPPDLQKAALRARSRSARIKITDGDLEARGREETSDNESPRSPRAAG